jgi:DNA-binding CsgD family transcriptional regulator/PAS domain-containing protein
MADERSAAIPHIIEELYAGTLDDAVWHRALVSVADLVRASGTLLLSFNPTTGAVLRDENHRIDPQAVIDYQSYWTFQDCRREPFLTTPPGMVVTERLLDIPDLERSPFYNEFLLPVDAPHVMPAWLHKKPNKAVCLSLQGTRQRGAFDRSDVRALQQQLLPHIARALEIRDRLAAAQIRTAALEHTLERFNCGLAVLDDTGRVLEANLITEQLLQAGEGVWRTSTGLLKLREPADGELKGWLKSGVPPAKSNGLLCVQRRDTLPLSLLLTPLPRARTTWLSDDPRWLMLLFDRTRRIGAASELLERDLGISAREAQVATRLFEGFSPLDIAHQLRVSLETVRTQLKSIFRKTGTSSQAELLRLIALGPAVRKSPAPEMHEGPLTQQNQKGLQRRQHE